MHPKSIETLDIEIDNLEARNGTQLAVVTVDSTEALSPKAFATQLFNHWGVGQKGVDNGVLILVAIKERRVEIEVGDGANKYLTDSMCSRILKEEVIPEFKKGDPSRGVVEAVRSVIRQLQDVNYSEPGVSTSNPQNLAEGDTHAETANHRPSEGYNGGGDSQNPWPWMGSFGAILFSLVLGARKYFRNKARVCPGCRRDMRRLSEHEEDAHLKSGQRMEEELGSVDYDVWVCRACDRQKIERYASWFNSFSNCSKCSYKTLESTRTTVHEATTYSEGKGRLDEYCRNCSYSHSSTYTIARLPEPSSTSSSSSSFGSSSSSGFGGGSSSGGGSGASW